MSLNTPPTIDFLQRHHSELVHFFPYAGNNDFSIQCYMIVRRFMPNNLNITNNCNIKLIAKNILETSVISLDNLNRIVFKNGESLDLSKYKIVPVFNELYTNIEKSTKLKKGIEIKNQYRYSDFEFVFLSPDEIFEIVTDKYSGFAVFEEKIKVLSPVGSGWTSFEETITA